jgi:hypothetical protein
MQNRMVVVGVVEPTVLEQLDLETVEQVDITISREQPCREQVAAEAADTHKVLPDLELVVLAEVVTVLTVALGLPQRLIRVPVVAADQTPSRQAEMAAPAS